MKKGRIITIVIIVVLAVLATVKLISNKKVITENSKEQTLDPNFKIPVYVHEVAKAPLGSSVSKSVTIKPFREAKVMVSQPGQIVKWNADLGDYFSQNAVLGHIDIKQTQLQLNSAELALKRLEKEYKRYSDLLAGGGIPEVNFDEVKFNYENTQIQVAQLKQKLADSYVRAPFSGVVTMKMIELGEFANPGQPLVFLTDISKLKVTARLTEAELQGVKLNDKVQVVVGENANEAAVGTITYVAPKADVAKNYEVEIVFDNPKNKFKAGGFGRANFGETSGEEVILIPREAIVESLKNPYVYIFKDGVAERKDIVIGRQANGNIEVLEGLNVGDVVITAGQINLQNGTLVEVIK